MKAAGQDPEMLRLLAGRTYEVGNLLAADLIEAALDCVDWDHLAQVLREEEGEK